VPRAAALWAQAGYTEEEYTEIVSGLRLFAALLFAWAPASAAVLAVERPIVPAAPFASAALLTAMTPFGGASLAPALPAPPSSVSALPLAAVVCAAPSAVAPAAPISAAANGLIHAPNIDAGLAALREASYPESAEVAKIVAAIKARHPQLPISAENLFLVRDPEMAARLELPANAGGAARIVTDGTREVPIVILVAGRGVALDAFVEYAVHEAVHLMDDGILRVNHDQELKHFFAEGWTQKRAVELANAVLADLDRPATPGRAYHQEIALIETFAKSHGTAALDELVRGGSDAGLRAALGPRWALAGRLASAPASREKRLNALTALVHADSLSPVDERTLLDYVGL